MFGCMLFLNSCSDNEQIQKPTLTEQTLIYREDGPGELVCNLIQATYDILNSTETNIDDWVDPDFFYLADLTNPTGPQIAQMHMYVHAAVDDLSEEDENFESLFTILLSMNLSQEDFEGYAEECSISRAARWCLFCNSQACANNIVLTNIGIITTSSETALLGMLGQWVHCNH